MIAPLGAHAILDSTARGLTQKRLECWRSNAAGISQYTGMKGVNFEQGKVGTWLFPPPGSSTFNFTAHRSPSLSVEVTPGEGMGWYIIEPDCRLLDLLSDKAIAKHLMRPNQDTQGILWLGDSLSNFESIGLCELLHIRAGSVENPGRVKNWFPGFWTGTHKHAGLGRYWHHYGAGYLNHCQLPNGLKIANSFLVGVSEDGPYFWSQVGGPAHRIKEVARHWRDGVAASLSDEHPTVGKITNLTMDGPPFPPFLPPSMVILSSAIWDQAGARDKNEYLNDTNRAVRVLPGDWLEQWGSNFTKVIGHVKKNFNQSLIVYKTTVLPMPAHRKIEDKDIGRQHYEKGDEIHFDEAGYDLLVSLTATRQINEIGRQVAKKEGLFILDSEAMSRWLSPRVYLRDGHHPSSLMVHDVNNFALNMLKDWLDSKEIDKARASYR